MTKITPDHLARSAFVYVRQSTAGQVPHNHESRRRQYALADRARNHGWQDVVVIDDDIGRSGSGASRPGFEKLLAAICEGKVGAVFAIEASRLARNGRDWHTLIEFCGLVNAIILDEDGVYDPRLPNDRLLLGMKGTMSELELSILRQRSLEALKQKAKRGELFMTVAIGYVKARHDRIALNALAQEQPFDAVDVENPLGDQRFTLSANPAAILFLGRWHPDHRANPRLSAFECPHLGESAPVDIQIRKCWTARTPELHAIGVHLIEFAVYGDTHCMR